MDEAREIIASYDHASNSTLRFIQNEFPHNKCEYVVKGDESWLVLDGIETSIHGKDLGVLYFQHKNILARVLNGIFAEVRQCLEYRSISHAL